MNHGSQALKAAAANPVKALEKEIVGAGFKLHQRSGDLADFERYPEGWGEDGNDRVERITIADGGARVYGTAYHCADSGDHYYRKEFKGDLREVLQGLEEDRAVAPNSRDGVVVQPAVVLAVKIDQMLRGEPVGLTDKECDAICEMDADWVNRFSTIPNPSQVGTLDLWLGRIRPAGATPRPTGLRGGDSSVPQTPIWTVEERLGAVKHHRASQTLLEILTVDPDESVREEAKRRLAARGGK